MDAHPTGSSESASVTPYQLGNSYPLHSCWNVAAPDMATQALYVASPWHCPVESKYVLSFVKSAGAFCFLHGSETTLYLSRSPSDMDSHKK